MAVDDLKPSHVNKRVNDEFYKWLKSKCEDEEISKMKATCGKMHDCLGMKLDCTKDCTVEADMVDCTQCMCDEFPVNLAKMRNVSGPAVSCLCKARDDVEKLTKPKAEIFHNMVARGSFLTRRSRGNIHAAMSFLCTRVQ